jgi:hypothetical protein
MRSPHSFHLFCLFENLTMAGPSEEPTENDTQHIRRGLTELQNSRVCKSDHKQQTDTPEASTMHESQIRVPTHALRFVRFDDG